MTKQFQYECAVIGGGPGGLVTAVYLGRALRKTVVIDNNEPRAKWIPRIKNLVGYREGLSGPRLLERLSEQVQLYKIDFIRGKAIVNPKAGAFEINVGTAKVTAKKVILATGMKDLQPPVRNFNKLRKKGLLAYCPICDGYENRREVIALLVDGVYGLKK